MKSHETLAFHESFRASEATGVDVALAHRDTAERMYASRASMLDSLASSLTSSLFDALARKIEHERTALLEMLVREEKVVEQKRRLDKVLPTQYFSYHKLDIHLL